MRKSSCPCGASVVRMSRAGLGTIEATCKVCTYALSPDCLHDGCYAGLDSAIDAIEAKYDRKLERDAPKSTGRRANMFRCGDCQKIRAASGPCSGCGSQRAPDTSYMSPRASRMLASAAMPF